MSFTFQARSYNCYSVVLYKKKKKRAEERHVYIYCQKFSVLRRINRREVALGTERGEGQRRNPLTGDGYLEVAVPHIRKDVGGKKMRFHPSCYMETSKPEIADFQTGQPAFPAMDWKVICKSLIGSLTSVFYLLKDRSSHSRCFTRTDVSYFVLTGFAFILL